MCVWDIDAVELVFHLMTPWPHVASKNTFHTLKLSFDDMFWCRRHFKLNVVNLASFRCSPTCYSTRRCWGYSTYYSVCRHTWHLCSRTYAGNDNEAALPALPKLLHCRNNQPHSPCLLPFSLLSLTPSTLPLNSPASLFPVPPRGCDIIGAADSLHPAFDRGVGSNESEVSRTGRKLRDCVNCGGLGLELDS